MLKFILALILSYTFMIGSAFAEQSPIGFKSDQRIKRYFYDENNVYKLDLYLKSVTALQFERGENVESILIGDSVSWEVVKLKSGNVISVKPIINAALTNMTVYTDRRVYTFELKAAGVMKAGLQAASSLSFRTTFTYPKEDFEVADDRLVHDGPINQDYLVSGHASFRPQTVTDNSHQTTFILPPGSPRPAIFKVGRDREERLVNSRTVKGQIIVDGISDYWVLRIGDETVCIGRAHAIQNSKMSRKGIRYAG